MNKEIIEKIANTHSATKQELIEILNDDTINNDLFLAADKIRKKFVGDEIHLRALIECSNFCKRTCFYCGLRCENKTIQRYRLPIDKIFELAKKAIELNFKTIVIQSGEDDFYTTEKMIQLLKKISSLKTRITLSIGEKSFEEYQAYKDAGADRYLLRIETTDKNLYTKLHPNMSFANRVNCLLNLKKLNYETGTGCLVGLPSQTTDSLACDLLFFKNNNMDMIGIGPFIPCSNTPLENLQCGDFTLTLKMLALTRLLLPYANIPATTAIETLKQNGRLLALNCGANVIMPNITDEVYRQKYAIYPDKAGMNVSTEENLQQLKDFLKTLNRPVSSGYGDRPKS